MTRRSHPLRPGRFAGAVSSIGTGLDGSLGGSVQEHEGGSGDEVESEGGSDDLGVETGSAEGRASSSMGEICRTLMVELPLSSWSLAKIQADMAGLSIEDYCRSVLVEAIETRRTHVRIEGLGREANLGLGLPSTIADFDPDDLANLDSETESTTIPVGEGASRVSMGNDTRYLSDWNPRASSWSSSALENSPMASPDVFSNAEIQFEESRSSSTPSSSIAAVFVDGPKETDLEVSFENDASDDSQPSLSLKDIVPEPTQSPVSVSVPDVDLTSPVSVRLDLDHPLDSAGGMSGLLLPEVIIPPEATLESESGRDLNNLEPRGLSEQEREEPEMGLAYLGSRSLPKRPQSLMLSPHREIVLRHASSNVDDLDAFLPCLRRGEAISPETAQELIDSLNALEIRLEGSDTIDRALAFSLHRLAFEGQVLLTDAWNHEPDETTIGILRVVQEAVDRVLSGEDIRYYRDDRMEINS